MEQSLSDADLVAAWSLIGEIAHRIEEKEAGRIFVKNDSGEVVILVGIAMARVLAAKAGAVLRS
jgi:hypothetical protein